MTVLITARNGKQTLGRCDARCYNKAGPRCQCICYGLNHGVGQATAQQNVLDHRAEIERHIKQRFPETTEILFHSPLQRSLFHAPQPNPHTLPRDAA